MNVLYYDDIRHEGCHDILLLVNGVTESQFGAFLTAISNRKDWISELCCCYYEAETNRYRFETEEDHNFDMYYETFLEYVVLAIRRYLHGCQSDLYREQIRQCIAETVFSRYAAQLNETETSSVPLVYGANA